MKRTASLRRTSRLKRISNKQRTKLRKWMAEAPADFAAANGQCQGRGLHR